MENKIFFYSFHEFYFTFSFEWIESPKKSISTEKLWSRTVSSSALLSAFNVLAKAMKREKLYSNGKIDFQLVLARNKAYSENEIM